MRFHMIVRPTLPGPVARPDDGDGVRIEDSVEQPALVAEDVVGQVRVLALFHPPLLVQVSRVSAQLRKYPSRDENKFPVL